MLTCFEPNYEFVFIFALTLVLLLRKCHKCSDVENIFNTYEYIFNIANII